MFLDPSTTRQSYGERRGTAMAALPNLRWKVPTSYKEARNSNSADAWQEAMHTELERLDEMGCWKLVDPPEGSRL